MENREDFHHDDFLDRAVDAVLRDPPPNELPPDQVAQLVAIVRQAADRPYSITLIERTRKMKRIAKFAVTAAALAAIGVFAFWMTSGGSDNLAFARVADALDSLRSATFNLAMETTGDNGQPPVTGTGKGFFLTPSRQRMEMSVGPAKDIADMITISDNQAAKAITLMPKQKIALAMEMEKMRENMKESAKGAPPDLFETVRRLVREGSSGTGEKAERLGKKEIDGRTAVGFRTHNNMADMTLWADPETARPIRIEMTGEMWADVHMVMNNFRYDVVLDPSLFSLEPPEGYSAQTMNVAVPVEEDLLRTLRTVAEHRKGVFPAKLGMNKEVMESLQSVLKPEMDKLEAKYNIKPKPGEKPPAAMMAEAMKTLMPLYQKQMQGIMFYMTLKPENDPHYVGGGVKLGTPDRAILWYKPTGADKYRVIYADLSVKEVPADEAPKVPQ